ncbi:MAG TPA: class I SAM-dependent methyltransferase, partial [Polyangia bacterium]|nr:class I SAM-dependent methyltransferase [Polyangia bacterium]
MSAAAAAEKQARLAKLYDDEISPAYAGRFATLLLRHVRPTSGARVVEIGCATGQVTRELSRRFDDKSHVTAFDDAEPFVAEARAKIEATDDLRAPITLRVAEPGALPADDGSVNLAVSNLAAAAAADPSAVVGEIARALAPGGIALVTAPLRGTWTEFLDLFREVLRENGKHNRLTAVDRYVTELPDAEQVTGWLRGAGLTN